MKTKYRLLLAILAVPLFLFFKIDSSNEIGYSMTTDKQTKYFSLKTNKGIGGYDIYKSERLEDGNWSKPDNLGRKINSKFDEINPVIDRDDVTLYYSVVKGKDTLKYTAVYGEDGMWRDIEQIDENSAAQNVQSNSVK